MLSPIFVANTKIISHHDFAVPLNVRLYTFVKQTHSCNWNKTRLLDNKSWEPLHTRVSCMDLSLWGYTCLYNCRTHFLKNLEQQNRWLYKQMWREAFSRRTKIKWKTMQSWKVQKMSNKSQCKTFCSHSLQTKKMKMLAKKWTNNKTFRLKWSHWIRIKGNYFLWTKIF